MKKFLTFLFAAVIFFFVPKSTNAQIGDLKTTANIAFDTVSNAATTKYLYTPSILGYNKVASFTLKAVKVSGTVGGTATLEASLDGSDWYPYYNAKDTSYSFTLTDVASQGFRWQIPDVGDLLFRVKVVVSGTQVARITGKYSFRK